MLQHAAARASKDAKSSSTAGPVEVALEEALSSCARKPSGCFTIEPSSRRAPGEVSVLPSGGGDWGRILRTSLPETVLRDVVEVPPRLYLKLNPRFIHDSVTSAVLSRPTSFGHGTGGIGYPTYVHFSSPNANKALHLGHLRNNALGMATANLFASQGHQVVRGEAVSDRGKHICKVLLAYRKWYGDATPEKAGMKPDHFVHEMYMRFQRQAAEHSARGDHGLDKDLEEAQRALEDGDFQWGHLNHLLTRWAYAGIRETYATIGTEIDVVIVESQTFQESTDIIGRALGKACRRRADGSISMDLSDVGLREVTLIGKNGTPLLYAQFLGVSTLRDALFPHHKVVNFMGNEWRDRVPELLEVLRRLGAERAAAQTEVAFHGMVRSAAGPLKSRQGTTHAEPLIIDAVVDRLARHIEESWFDLPPTDSLQSTYAERLAVALLKYAFLRVTRGKDLVYDESELCRSTMRDFRRLIEVFNATIDAPEGSPQSCEIDDSATPLLLAVNLFPSVVIQALERRDPSPLLRLLEDIVAQVHSTKSFLRRADLRRAVGIVLRQGLSLLNITVPPLPRHL